MSCIVSLLYSYLERIVLSNIEYITDVVIKTPMVTMSYKKYCKCGCEIQLTDYEYQKFSGYKRGHASLQ